VKESGGAGADDNLLGPTSGEAGTGFFQ